MSILPLGKESSYPTSYAPSVLYPVLRAQYRARIAQRVDCEGSDVWNCFELSWLSQSGQPRVGIAQLEVPSSSAAIVESKSLKLYLGSLAAERYESCAQISAVVQSDLRSLLGSNDLTFVITEPAQWPAEKIAPPPGESLDSRSVDCTQFDYAPSLLSSTAGSVPTGEFIVHSNLFRSLCPVTNQPDWATVIIAATGGRWDFDRVLQYLVSFRTHAGFHEHCCETIFSDLHNYCRPQKLYVECRFTRRGGIDINPWRSTSLGYRPFTTAARARFARQ